MNAVTGPTGRHQIGFLSVSASACGLVRGDTPLGTSPGGTKTDEAQSIKESPGVCRGFKATEETVQEIRPLDAPILSQAQITQMVFQKMQDVVQEMQDQVVLEL